MPACQRFISSLLHQCSDGGDCNGAQSAPHDCCWLTRWRCVLLSIKLSAFYAPAETETELLRLFFTLAQLTRAPVSSAFSVHGLINHSCDPNVQRTFATAGKDEHWLLLRAAEDLESGEELMDSC
eukprot:g6355.t1